jgi:hypothetical protein
MSNGVAKRHLISTRQLMKSRGLGNVRRDDIGVAAEQVTALLDRARYVPD